MVGTFEMLIRVIRQFCLTLYSLMPLCLLSSCLRACCLDNFLSFTVLSEARGCCPSPKPLWRRHDAASYNNPDPMYFTPVTWSRTAWSTRCRGQTASEHHRHRRDSASIASTHSHAKWSVEELLPWRWRTKPWKGIVTKRAIRMINRYHFSYI